MDVFVQEKGVYRFGPFRLDPTRRVLLRDDAPVKLPDRLFDTLHVLVASQGRVVGRDELLRTVWSGRVVEESNLSQAVFALRKLLQADGPSEGFIVTSPGRGYRFAGSVVFEPDAAPSIGRPEEPPALAAAAAPSRLRRLPAGAALIAALGLAAAVLALARPGAPGKASVPPPRSVAVLAFEDESGDPEQAYLSDGLSEQLIASLASVDSLRVAARASAFSFRGMKADPAEMAHKLNVGALLQGSVRRAGAHLRVSAQLVDAETGYVRWSKTYDSDQNDMLAIEADIALAVTASLRAGPSGADASKLTLGGATRADAFDAFLRGKRRLRGAASDPDYRGALAEFDAAISLDPDFAEAHANRAIALGYLGATAAIRDHGEQRRLVGEALAAADRAVELAPGLALAHSARGLVLGWGFLDFKHDAIEQERALALAPGDAGIQSGFAYAESAAGHMDVAVAAARRAAELDPMAPQAWFDLGRVLFLARRYDDAIGAVRHAEATAQTVSSRLPVLVARVRLMQGDAEGARRSCAEGASFGQLAMLAIAYHRLGRQGEADVQLDKLHDLIGEDGAYLYATIYAQWGRQADSLVWLEAAARMQDAGLVDMAADPLLDPIRDTAGFKSVQRMVTDSAL